MSSECPNWCATYATDTSTDRRYATDSCRNADPRATRGWITLEVA